MSLQKSLAEFFYASVFVQWLLLGTFVLLVFWDYFGRTARFFKHHNVKYDRGLLLFGSHYRQVFNIESTRATVQKWYEKFVGEPFIGLHEFGGKASYLIRDPELVKRILVRDFNYFVNRYGGVNASTDPLIGHQLTNLETDNWRRIRTLLTPMFTSQKIKQIVIPSLHETRLELVDYLLEKFAAEKSQSITVDMLELSTRSGTDGFCRSALGIKTDSLRNNDGGFFVTGDAYVKHLDGLGGFEYFGIMKLPRVMKYLLKSTLTQPKVDAFYRDTFLQITDTRIAKSIQRNDYLRLLQTLRDTTVTEGDSDRMPEKGTQHSLYLDAVIFHFQSLLYSVHLQLPPTQRPRRYRSYLNFSKVSSPKTIY